MLGETHPTFKLMIMLRINRIALMALCGSAAKKRKHRGLQITAHVPVGKDGPGRRIDMMEVL
jgi:hypothetical protein